MAPEPTPNAHPRHHHTVHRIFLGILALLATAGLAIVAIGTTRHAPEHPSSHTLVILEGLPEPAAHATQLRIAVIDLDLLHSLQPLHSARSRQQAEDTLRNLAGHIAFRRPDILVVHNLPLDGPATRDARTLQTLAVHTELPWQVALPLHNRRFLPAPALPPNLPSGPLVAGTALLSRYPIVDVTGTPLPFDHRHGTLHRLWGSRPGRLLVRLRIGPEDHHYVTIAIHDQATEDALLAHLPLPTEPDEDTDAPRQDFPPRDAYLPPAPATLVFARTLQDYTSDSPEPSTLPLDDSTWTTRERTADGLLHFTASGWRPMIVDGDVRIPGLPHPMLLLEIERARQEVEP